MKCPVCKSSVLISKNLESNLGALACRECGGNWVSGAAYWKWIEQNGRNLPELADQDDGLTLAEPGKYIDCPECQFRLVKYLVGRGFNFTLDHCEGCKGTWLDRHEWEVLKKRNLHDDLHSMLTAFWQDTARKELRKKKLEQIYVTRFGAEDYAEIKRIRAWIDDHADKMSLLAYLTDVDPFDV